MRSDRKIKVWIMDLVIVLGLAALDQYTKYLAVARLKDRPAVVLVDGVLELQYLENRGVAFSMFQNKTVFILILGFLVTGIILFFLLRVPQDKKYRVVHVLAAALLAGALGNIIDRIRLDFVVDFISFVLIDYPVFNVADCYIVVSTILLFVLFLFVYKEEDLAFLSLKRQG